MVLIIKLVSGNEPYIISLCPVDKIRRFQYIKNVYGFRVSYIAMEAGHRCECEECPICACIEICEAVINQVGSAFAVIIVAVLGLLSFISSSDMVICHIIRQTPVTYKIRMNN